MRLLRCALLLALAMRVLANDSSSAPTGLQTDVVFTGYSPLSSSAELIRRLFTPLQAQRTNLAIAQSARRVNEQSVDLARERFAVYVPPTKPPGGYSLLVFVPPWQQAKVPANWTSELDKHGVAFVTAANSGNDASVLDRREPLALLAAHNMLQRYPIDPNRIYIGGFSGGSRIALRLVLAYPDLFRGALLNAGSDPIGTEQIPLPTADLMHAFQESTRLVYLTGKDDAPRLEMDVRSRKTMHDWCVFDVKSILVPWSGHEVPSTAAFDQGLVALEAHANPAPDELAACRRRYEQDLNTQLSEVEQLQKNRKVDAARAALDKVDVRYGGLAAPRSVELAQSVGAAR